MKLWWILFEICLRFGWDLFEIWLRRSKTQCCDGSRAHVLHHFGLEFARFAPWGNCIPTPVTNNFSESESWAISTKSQTNLKQISNKSQTRAINNSRQYYLIYDAYDRKNLLIYKNPIFLYQIYNSWFRAFPDVAEVQPRVGLMSSQPAHPKQIEVQPSRPDELSYGPPKTNRGANPGHMSSHMAQPKQSKDSPLSWIGSLYLG